MNSLNKNLLGGFACGLILLTAPALAASDSNQTKHKVIEIKAEKNQDVKVMIESNGHSESVFISMDELNDPTAVNSKLVNLDDDTRATVINVLEDLKNMDDENLSAKSMLHDHKGKVVVMHKGHGELIKTFSANEDHDIDIEMLEEGEYKIIKKHVVIGEHDGVITGHSAAIASLISKGKFSQEELDEIQAAIDSKR